MKKVVTSVLLLAAVILLFTYCSREEEFLPEDENATLSFGAVLNDLVTNNSDLKQAIEALPECSDAAPAFVEVVLSGTAEVGTMETPVVLEVNPSPADYDGDGEEEYFTEESLELELEPGSYSLEFFAVYDGDPSAETSNLIWLAPRSDGSFAGLVSDPLPVNIELGAGVKKYVDVEVLCFDDRVVNEYGYLFFDLMDIEVVEFCAFANFCDENGRHFTANYTLSLWVGTDGSGEALVTGSPVTGINEQEDFFAQPVCVSVPSPGAGIAPDEAYLYYELVLEDWEGNYGDVAPQTISGTLSWNDIAANFSGDDAVEYEHFGFGCDGEAGPAEPGDDDGDGVDDDTDNCPDAVNPDQADADGDEIGDACDTCPAVSNPDQADTDGDGIGDACEEAEAPDGDDDGVSDEEDNCPEKSNPDQADSDGDGVGDACEEAEAPDGDDDGVSDEEDNCPEKSNPDQADADGDGVGDACDEAEAPDGDGDGVSDEEDNCPEMSNPDQADADSDGVGDACDEAEAPDGDGDGVSDEEDNCPDMSNPDQADADGDGVGDVCDNSGTTGDEGQLINGENHIGEITLGDLDTWAFSVVEGDFIHLTMARASGTVNPEFRLISPTGDVVGHAWTFGESVPMVVQKAPVSGIYRVIAGDSHANNTGEYVLRLAQAPQDYEVPSGDEGGVLTNTASHSGEITLGDLDQWTLIADGGSFIHLTMARSSGGVNPEFRLIAPSGDVVGHSWTFGETTQLVVQDAPESGAYRIIVGDSHVNSTGGYVLTASW